MLGLIHLALYSRQRTEIRGQRTAIFRIRKAQVGRKKPEVGGRLTDDGNQTKHLNQRPMTKQIAAGLWCWVKKDFFGFAWKMRWSYLPPVFSAEPGNRLIGGPRVILQTIIKVGVDKIPSCDHIHNRIVEAVQLFTQKGQPVAENCWELLINDRCLKGEM